MSETSERCPLCGLELTDIRERQEAIDAAAGTEWGCWSMRDAEPPRSGLDHAGCGARGGFVGGEPVADETDAARLATMKDRLVDAMMASSDRALVMRLIDCYVSLRMNDGGDWYSPDDGEAKWCHHEQRREIEEDMRSCEETLSPV